MTSGREPELAPAARLWAAHHHPYLASALFAMPMLSAPGSGGVAVDEAWRVYVDPDVAGLWGADRLGAELVHLSGHLLRDHARRARAQGLQADEVDHWIDAADAEITDDLAADIRARLDAATPDDLDAHDGQFAEEYFRFGAPRPQPPRDCGTGAHGHDRQWNEPHGGDGDSEGVDAAEADLIRRKVAQDVMDHQRREGAPAGLVRWANGVLHPTVDWRTVLGAVLRRELGATTGAVDYSYARPSRRAAAAPGVVLPSLRRPRIGVAVVLDTSASMDEARLAMALTELDGLLRSSGVRPDDVVVVACDADAQGPQRVRSSQEVILVGGGGTDLVQGLTVALEARPRPDVVVVATDGFTPWPSEPPRCPMIVVLIGDDPPSAPSWCTEVRVSG